MHLTSHNKFRTFFMFTALSLVLPLLISTNASAERFTIRPANETPYVEPRKFDDNGEKFTSQYYPKTLSQGTIALLRDPILEPEQFVIKLTFGESATGCFKVSDMGYDAEFIGNRLQIDTNEVYIDFRDQTNNPHFECDKTTKEPTASIIMSKAMLEENGTEIIHIRSDTIENRFDIFMDEQHIKLLPATTDVYPTRYYKPQTLPGGKNALIHWFYPENTIVVYTPSVDMDAHIDDEIMAFGQAHNLKPLKTVYPTFTTPIQTPHYYYFVDEVGYFAKKLNSEKGIEIGSVELTKKVYGLKGDEIKPYSSPVYAKLPGTYQ